LAICWAIVDSGFSFCSEFIFRNPRASSLAADRRPRQASGRLLTCDRFGARSRSGLVQHAARRFDGWSKKEADAEERFVHPRRLTL
jgi:hypothetical protein